jgi:hypothetical protein
VGASLLGRGFTFGYFEELFEGMVAGEALVFVGGHDVDLRIYVFDSPIAWAPGWFSACVLEYVNSHITQTTLQITNPHTISRPIYVNFSIRLSTSAALGVP